MQTGTATAEPWNQEGPHLKVITVKYITANTVTVLIIHTQISCVYSNSYKTASKNMHLCQGHSLPIISCHWK
jgi:hypothetical protein